jgi:hypothetical protein
MKVVSVAEAATQLGKLIADAVNGEAIFLTNGVSEVRLTPRSSEEEIDFNSPELKEALLLGLEGTPEPYSPEELDKACREALKKRKSS